MQPAATIAPPPVRLLRSDLSKNPGRRASVKVFLIGHGEDRGFGLALRFIAALTGVEKPVPYCGRKLGVMAGAGGSMAADESDPLRLFVSIGLSESKARETLRNEALTALLREAVVQVSVAALLFVCSPFAVSRAVPGVALPRFYAPPSGSDPAL